MCDSRDEAAFRRLYARHTPSLYALASRLLAGRSSDAEDVVQETWVRAVGRFGNFGWQSSLRTWLYAILVNCCRELWRSRREMVSDHDLDLAITVTNTGLSLDIESALNQLPTGYRAVLVLHDILGLTHEEIGAQLAIEVGTSKSQLSRARHAMRRLLGTDYTQHARED